MKRINNKLWLAALPLAFAACQNDELEAGPDHAGKVAGTTVLRAVMNGYVPQGRAQVELNHPDEAEEVFRWNSGDSLTVYDQADWTSSMAFGISGYSDENPDAAAYFVGQGELAEGTVVTAVYPAQAGTVDSEGTLALRMANYAHDTMTEGTDAEWAAYMSANMYMAGTAAISGAGTTLQLKQLCAMARITYSNMTSEAQAVTTCILSGGDGKYFAEAASLDMATGVATSTTTTGVAGITFENLTVASGQSCDIYLLFFPGEAFAADGALTFSIGDKETPAFSTADILSANSGATGFEAGKRYWFTVVQTEQDGLVWKKDMPEGVIYNLPFIQAVENSLGIAFVKDDNGFVNVETNKETIESVTELWISGNDGLDSMEGIEYFTNLERLHCEYNSNLTSLDISNNAKLVYLRCNNDALTRLDVSRNTQLQELYCGNNPLASLDLSANTELTVLDCYKDPDVGNKMTGLDVTNNEKLTALYCGGNQIAALDLSKNTALRTLNLTYGTSGGSWGSDTPSNLITSLDLGNNTELETLVVNNCQLLSSLDISALANLKRLEYSSTKLALDISHNLALTYLYCRDNRQITSLDLSKHTELTYLDCCYTGITSLDVTHNQLLEQLYCLSWEITEIDLSQNTALRSLQCGGGTLETIDLTHNTALTDLQVIASRVTSLDVSKLTELVRLHCYENRMQELDITNNLQLEDLSCGDQRDADGNDLELTLTMLNSQASLWESMLSNWGNSRVTVKYADEAAE